MKTCPKVPESLLDTIYKEINSQSPPQRSLILEIALCSTSVQLYIHDNIMYVYLHTCIHRSVLIFYRYYLRNNMSQETLVPDDAAQDMVKETHFTFLSLNPMEIAMQLTVNDYKV